MSDRTNVPGTKQTNQTNWNWRDNLPGSISPKEAQISVTPDGRIVITAYEQSNNACKGLLRYKKVIYTNGQAIKFGERADPVSRPLSKDDCGGHAMITSAYMNANRAYKVEPSKLLVIGSKLYASGTISGKDLSNIVGAATQSYFSK